MSEKIEAIATDIVDCVIKIHKELGPGLLESAYQHCMAHELRKRDREVQTEVLLPIVYDGQHINAGYRIDMLIDGLVIIENKTVEQLLPIHMAQLMTYLKLSGNHVGFLLNWNVKLMKYGIRRVVHDLQIPSPYPKRQQSFTP